MSIWQRLISRTRNQKEDSIQREAIESAKKYLEKIHPQKRRTENNEYRYLKTSYKGKHVRYHFQRGADDRITYVVLSDEERSEIIKTFTEQKGEGYAYYDSAILGRGNVSVQHRFYQPDAHNTSLTFMTDHGDVWGGNFGMDPGD